MSRTLGRSLSAQPGHGQDQARHQGDQHHDGQDDPHQFRIPAALRGGFEVEGSPGERQRNSEQDGDGDPAGGGHDGAGTQRDRDVVALPLEEAHPGGEDGGRAAGQRAERVGELDRHRPAERKRPGHAADTFQAGRHVGELSEDERHDDP
jgi:hypothetical protein